MGGRLIITNGDAAVERMREARIGGEILPWRDILHEGPVPAGLSLEELSGIRAQFLAERGWASVEELYTGFQARDAIIRQHANYDTILLWFEHDLYDQLQLLQILDFFAETNRRSGLYLIQSGQYLGDENPRSLTGHMKLAEPVSLAHLALAKLAWNAFRSPTPAAWLSLLRMNTHVMPFLRLALLRLLEELPDPRSGLSRTEWTILALITHGVNTPRTIFEAFLDYEEMRFMGDWGFYYTLDQLGGAGAALIAGLNGLAFEPGMPEEAREAYLNAELSFTHLGYAVVTGNTDALLYRRNGRYIGGSLIQARAPWRWDRHYRRLLPPPA